MGWCLIRVPDPFLLNYKQSAKMSLLILAQIIIIIIIINIIDFNSSSGT